MIRLGRERQSPHSSHRLVDRLRVSRDPGRMLAQANLQLAEGRPDAAVVLLTAARRRSHDPEIEHRLLEARFQAFAQTTPPAPPPWPASVPDLFPGEKIPEIARRDLGPERLRSAITHHGSLIIRGFADPTQVTRSVDEHRAAFSAYDASAADPTDPDLAGWFTPFPHDRVSNRALKRERGHDSRGRLSPGDVCAHRHIRGGPRRPAHVRLLR